MLREWKPVKHRKVVYVTSCAMATLLLLVVRAGFSGIIQEGHAVSKTNLVVRSFQSLMGPVVMILLLRPPAWLISATATVGGLLFSVIGY